jgi:hypothetical protein
MGLLGLCLAPRRDETNQAAHEPAHRMAIRPAPTTLEWLMARVEQFAPKIELTTISDSVAPPRQLATINDNSRQDAGDGA